METDRYRGSTGGLDLGTKREIIWDFVYKRSNNKGDRKKETSRKKKNAGKKRSEESKWNASAENLNWRSLPPKKHYHGRKL